MPALGQTRAKATGKTAELLAYETETICRTCQLNNGGIKVDACTGGLFGTINYVWKKEIEPRNGVQFFA